MGYKSTGKYIKNVLLHMTEKAVLSSKKWKMSELISGNLKT